MTRAEFEKSLQRAIRLIPADFLEKIDNLSLQIEDWASADIMAEVGCTNRRDLLGFYTGCPLPERDLDSPVCLPDIILLFQLAIEIEAQESGIDIECVIAETLIHELAHYFGFSEQELDEIEALWERKGIFSLNKKGSDA